MKCLNPWSIIKYLLLNGRLQSLLMTWCDDSTLCPVPERCLLTSLPLLPSCTLSRCFLISHPQVGRFCIPGPRAGCLLMRISVTICPVSCQCLHTAWSSSHAEREAQASLPWFIPLSLSWSVSHRFTLSLLGRQKKFLLIFPGSSDPWEHAFCCWILGHLHFHSPSKLFLTHMESISIGLLMILENAYPLALCCLPFVCALNFLSVKWTPWLSCWCGISFEFFVNAVGSLWF